MEIDGVKIEPCKFCGNPAPVLYRKDGAYFIKCGRYLCDTRLTLISYDKKALINKWNDENIDTKGGDI